jgi:hypothetical protein
MSSLSIVNLRFPESPVLRCRVCGFAEVRTDEVAECGLMLAECPRCEHRWTDRLRPTHHAQPVYHAQPDHHAQPEQPRPARVAALAPLEEAATAA